MCGFLVFIFVSNLRGSLCVMDVVLGDFMSSIGYRVKSLDNLFGDIKGKEL